MNNLLIAGILYTIIMAFIVWKYKIRSIEIIIFMILFDPLITTIQNFEFLQFLLIIGFSVIFSFYKIFSYSKEKLFLGNKINSDIGRIILNFVGFFFTFLGTGMIFKFILAYTKAFQNPDGLGRVILVGIIQYTLGLFFAYVIYFNKKLKYLIMILIVIGFIGFAMKLLDLHINGF